jgi:hypothetical protein
VASATVAAHEFDNPVPLPVPDSSLHSPMREPHLRLKKADQDAAWQAAMEAFILVADLGGPTLFARVGDIRGRRS